MGMVRRIYVEKKAPYAVKAKELMGDLKNYLGLDNVEAVREFIRYDVENISDEIFAKACKTVFSEPPVDDLYEETIEIPANGHVFSVEYLPGQFDQRADSAVQCVQFLKEDENPIIKTAVTYMIIGDISAEEMDKIKAYCINPVDSRETDMVKPDTLVTEFEDPADVAIFDGFTAMSEEELKKLYDSLGLAMTFKDFQSVDPAVFTGVGRCPQKPMGVSGKHDRVAPRQQRSELPAFGRVFGRTVKQPAGGTARNEGPVRQQKNVSGAGAFFEQPLEQREIGPRRIEVDDHIRVRPVPERKATPSSLRKGAYGQGRLFPDGNRLWCRPGA